MKKTILFFALMVVIFGCKRQPEPFEYTIRGTIIGKKSGQFYLSESPRLGDEIIISFDNHFFEHSGSSAYMYTSFIFPDHSLQSVFYCVIEPGEVVLELKWDALQEKSVVLSGDYNLAMHKAQQEFMELFADIDFDSDESRAKIFNWMIDNSNNIATIRMLSSWESFDDFLPIEKLGEFVKSVNDKNLRNSIEFIELHSLWIAKKDNINSIDSKAMNFKLIDIEGNNIDFHSVSEGKLTFVEKSGSWCGNSTRNTRNLLPVYKKYKNNGLEIITIVPESKKERWQNWLNQEEFPWINLVELDSDLPSRKLSYSSMLFRGGNFLVDEAGVVIANDLSAETLNEILMKRFEPEAYERYITEKWEMPANIFILDKEKPIKSFDELVERMAGRPFLIDCWATWCSPCFDEFKFNDQLKAFLKTKNMAVVYISFDRPEDEPKWLNAIRDNNLQGYHFRLNNSFMNELAEIGFSGILPTYIIVNEKGVVVENNAFRPSQTEKLYNQIISALK